MHALKLGRQAMEVIKQNSIRPKLVAQVRRWDGGPRGAEGRRPQGLRVEPQGLCRGLVIRC